METKIKKQDVLDKYKGKSYSEAAEAISKKWSNRVNDPIEENSFVVEMEMLAKAQEVAAARDVVKQQMKQFRNGGMLNSYGNGGSINPADALALYLKQQNQIGLDAGNNLSQGLIGMNTDYNSSKNLMATPEMLPQVNNTGSTQIPSNPFVSKTTINPDVVSGITEESNPYKFKNAQGFQTLTNPNVSTEPTNTTDEISAYTPALIGQGVSTLLNAGILAGGYDKVAPVDNPYESDVKRLMASRGIDTTQQRNQILSAYNAAKSNLNNSRSANVRNALDTNLMNITQDNLASSKLQEQQINQGYKGEFANVLNNLGQQKAQAQTYSEDATAKNKGNFQSNLSAFGKNIADNSQFFTTAKLNTVQNKLLSDILSNKYADIGLNSDIVTRMSEGKLTPDDITTLKAKLPKDVVEGIIKSYNDIYGN